MVLPPTGNFEPVPTKVDGFSETGDGLADATVEDLCLFRLGIGRCFAEWWEPLADADVTSVAANRAHSHVQ